MVHRFTPAVLAFILVVAACGNDDTDDATTSLDVGPTTTAMPSTTTSETTEAPASADASTAPLSTATVSVDRRIPFTVDVDRSFGTTGNPGGYVDVFAPEGDGLWPVVVFLHGAASPEFGGADSAPHTTAGCPPDCEGFYDAHLSHVAGQGAVVISVAYDWRVPSELDRQVADVSCVGPMVAEIAPRYGGDTSRTVLAGHSRGATLAAAMALSGFSTPPADECAAHNETRPVVVGLVGLSGDYPLLGFPDPDDTQRIKIPVIARDSFVAGDQVTERLTAADVYSALSGYAHVGSGPTPPVRLFYGTRDDFSASGYAESFAEELRLAGYDAAVAEFDGQHHESIYVPLRPCPTCEPSTQPTPANLANLEVILDLAGG